MLVLLRKVGEEIVIKDEISVRVVRVSGNRAFLAIEAPEKVSVDRKEIWLAKKRECLAAGSSESAKTAGPDETRQSESWCEAGSQPASVGASFVRRAIPMLNRVAGKDRLEEDLAGRDDQSRVLQRSVPPGGQPSTSGLRAAVNHLIAASQACDGPEIEFWDDLATDDLSPELRQAVLSIVQELLLNACRHSKSKNVLLGMAQDDGCLCVQVQDWGIGFDPEPDQPHIRGLKGIRDLIGWLGGTLDIDSHRGKGTCVIVEVPLSKETDPCEPGTSPRPR